MSYEYYDYIDLGIVSANKPLNNQMWVENNGVLYMIDSVDDTLLLKSINKALSWVELRDDATSYVRIFRDTTHIYFIMSDGEIDRLTLSDDTYTASWYSPVDISVAEYDYYDPSGTYGCFLYAWNDAGDLTLSIEVGIDDGAPIVVQHNNNMGTIGIRTYACTQISYVYRGPTEDVFDYYFLWKWSDEHVELWKFDNNASTFSEVVDCGANTELPPISQWAIAYDGSDVLYFVLEDTNDSKFYLYSYVISTDTLTKLSEFNVVLMLDRNVRGTTAPFILEKGFHVSEDKVYQIPSIYSGRLNLISVFDFTDVIIAISDHFVMDSGGKVYELVDLIAYIFEGWIYHSRNSYPYLEMKFNSDNITIVPQQFIQIIGPYTANDSNRIFYGTYNFKDDTIGATPSGWTGASATVIYKYWQYHRKILQLTRDGSSPEIAQEFGVDRENGTIEFYMGSDDVTQLTHFRLYHGGTLAIIISLKADKITRYKGGYINVCDAVDDVLYLIRIDFECGGDAYLGLAPDTYNIHVNGTEYGPYDFEVAVVHLDKIQVVCNTVAVYKGYFDAFGYSWDTGYTIGDNQYVEEGEPNQVVFEGIAVKPTKGRVQFVLIENQGSEMDHIKPRGNKSGRSDEIISDINDDGAPDGPEYIRDGTLANGGAMGTLDLSGAKIYRTVLNDFAEHDVFLWNLRPQGALDYNDGSVVSGADIRNDQSTYIDAIVGLKAWTVAKLNQIIVNGALNPITGKPYIGIWNDIEDQQTNGINSDTIEDAQLNSDALCQAKADTIGANESVRIRAQFKFRKTEYGFIQPGQTITLLYDITDYMTIAEAQYILDRFRVNIKTEVGYAEVSSGL